MRPAPHYEASPIDQRRIRDGINALNVRVPGDNATDIDLRYYLDHLADGIVALQSLDDLGEPMDAWVMELHDTLMERHDAVKAWRAIKPFSSTPS